MTILQKKTLFFTTTQKTLFFWAFFEIFFFHFFHVFSFSFSNIKKTKTKSAHFFSKTLFLTPWQTAKKIFSHTYTLFVFFKIPKKHYKTGEKQAKKNLGPHFDATLDHILTQKTPNLGPHFDSTAYLNRWKDRCLMRPSPSFWPPCFRKTWEPWNCPFQKQPTRKMGTRSRQCRPKVPGMFAFPGAQNPRICSISRFGTKFSGNFSGTFRSFPQEPPNFQQTSETATAFSSFLTAAARLSRCCDITESPPPPPCFALLWQGAILPALQRLAPYCAQRQAFSG